MALAGIEDIAEVAQGNALVVAVGKSGLVCRRTNDT
jgi:hypothetical protein